MLPRVFTILGPHNLVIDNCRFSSFVCDKISLVKLILGICNCPIISTFSILLFSSIITFSSSLVITLPSLKENLKPSDFSLLEQFIFKYIIKNIIKNNTMKSLIIFFKDKFIYIFFTSNKIIRTYHYYVYR